MTHTASGNFYGDAGHHVLSLLRSHVPLWHNPSTDTGHPDIFRHVHLPYNSVIVFYITGYFTNLGTQVNYASTDPSFSPWSSTYASLQAAEAACENPSPSYYCNFVSFGLTNKQLPVDLGITKGVSTPPAPPVSQPGNIIVTYTITVTNNGPGIIYPGNLVQVADTLPTTTPFAVVYSPYPINTTNLACVGPSGISCAFAPPIPNVGYIGSPNGSIAVLINILGSSALPATQSITITFNVTFPYSECQPGAVVNTVAMGYSNFVATISDTNPVNNTYPCTGCSSYSSELAS